MEIPPSERSGPRSRPSRLRIIMEEVLIFVSIGVLFVLGVFYRHTAWGQMGLGLLLVVMLVLFVIRLRRVQRAFKEESVEGSGKGGPA